jgi:hypothetical protein
MTGTTRATVYLPHPGWPRRAALIGLLVCAAVAGTSAQVLPVDRLVAVVEERALTASDLRVAMRLGSIPGEAPDEVALVEQLVARELVRHEMERFDVPEPPRERVDARVLALAGGRSLDDFLAELAALGVPRDGVTRIVADDLKIAAYVEQRFTTAAQPTDVEVTTRAAADGDASAAGLAAARRALVAERTQVLVGDWVSGLRRRAAVRLAVSP